MNITHNQEQYIFNKLSDTFEQHGFSTFFDKKQFRKDSKKGIQSVSILLKENEDDTVLEMNLGIRFNLVEQLVCQFLNDMDDPDQDIPTISTTLHHLNAKPAHKIKHAIKDIDKVCARVSSLMQKKGFYFLERCSKLKQVDALLNRKPYHICPYIGNQIHRCFKGIIVARMVQRSKFDMLANTYSNYLYSNWVPSPTRERFDQLVAYLKTFSFN